MPTSPMEEGAMTDPTVRIVELEPLRVVAALGFGPSPEEEAWRLIEAFAEDHGLDMWSGEHRFFGFNNPDPSPGSPNYGYEQWMTVPADVTAEAPYEIKHVPAGRYVALGFTGLEQIGANWKHLIGWFEEHGHALPADRERCLEELHTSTDQAPETWRFDLYVGLED